MGEADKHSEERFTQIMTNYLRHKDLSPEGKLVGAVIASYANSDVQAWPGTERLMRDTRFGRHVVERARSELVKGGWLQKLYSRGDSGKFRRVRYRVTEKILHYRFPQNQGKRANERIESPYPPKTGKP